MATGERCKANRLHDGDKCFIHSKTPEQRSAWASYAAKSKSAPRLPFNFEESLWFVGLLVSLFNLATDAHKLLDFLAPLLAADFDQRQELERLLHSVEPFERESIPADTQAEARDFLKLGIENGYLDIETFTPELRELVG
jgi:hypothetical protein